MVLLLFPIVFILFLSVYVLLKSVKLIKKDKNDESVPKGSKDIPGPLHLPLFGTKWIYLWKYDLSKMHEAYEGKK